MKKKLSDLQLCTDKLTAENIEIKQNFVKSDSYAAKVQGNHHTGIKSNKKDSEGQLTKDYSLPPPVSRVGGDFGLLRSNPDSHQTHMPPTGGLSDLLNTTQMASADSKNYQNASIEADGFKFPKKKKRPTVIVGKGSSSASVKGAPEPSRDAFLYRIDKETNSENLVDYLSDKNITVRQVVCMSKQESAFKSFKITVAVSNFSALFDPNLWPEGVRIRKFYKNRKTTQHGVG